MTKSIRMPKTHRDTEDSTARKHRQDGGKEGVGYYLFLIVNALLVIIAIYNVFIVTASNDAISREIDAAAELARPGKLKITAITVSGCERCYDINPLIGLIKGMDINVTSERTIEYNSNEAIKLIADYNIKRLPTIIITGEINKSRSFQSSFSSYGEQIKDAVVLTKQVPPYFSISEKKVVGLVTLTLIKDSACNVCSSLDPLIKSLKDGGLVISKENTFDITSEEGKEVIEAYSLSRAPSLILSREASYYPGFEDTWKNIGGYEKDSFVLKNPNPPYRDLGTGELKGVVYLIMLGDSSCASCYDPSFHKSILLRFGITPAVEETVDISSARGKELLIKYNITSVPTIILSEETGEYAQLVSIWTQVGSVEKDGYYIFRNLEAMGKPVYKDLLTGSLVNAIQ